MLSFTNDKPIYAQIVDLVELRIVTGVYQPQSKLPSVRDLAMEMGVNPNTMQRALATLETEGFVKSERTSGRFVTDDAALISEKRESLTREKTQDFVQSMRHYGCNDAEIVATVQHFLND